MNIPEKIWKIASWIGVLVVIVLIIGSFIGLRVLFNSNGSNYKNQTVPTIYVTGTGDAYSIPDVAAFSFSVTANAKTVTDAQTQATTKINAALKTVRDAGVADKDIQTTSYNVSPHYDYQNGVCPMIATAGGAPAYCPPGKSVLTGYDVSQTITVKIRNLDNAGSLFASIGALKVDNLNGLNFSVDNPDSVQAEARDKAIADAKSKADVLANQLGVHLVRVISFSEDNGSVYPQPMMYSMTDAVSASGKAIVAPEIPIGHNKVTSNVTITYEIR